MKALGIVFKKEEIRMYMAKADRDGSGFVDLNEFIALVAEVIE